MEITQQSDALFYNVLLQTGLARLIGYFYSKQGHFSNDLADSGFQVVLSLADTGICFGP